jgi:hypothetical protein
MHICAAADICDEKEVCEHGTLHTKNEQCQRECTWQVMRKGNRTTICEPEGGD